MKQTIQEKYIGTVSAVVVDCYEDEIIGLGCNNVAQETEKFRDEISNMIIDDLLSIAESYGLDEGDLNPDSFGEQLL